MDGCKSAKQTVQTQKTMAKVCIMDENRGFTHQHGKTQAY